MCFKDVRDQHSPLTANWIGSDIQCLRRTSIHVLLANLQSLIFNTIKSCECSYVDAVAKSGRKNSLHFNQSQGELVRRVLGGGCKNSHLNFSAQQMLHSNS